MTHNNSNDCNSLNHINNVTKYIACWGINGQCITSNAFFYNAKDYTSSTDTKIEIGKIQSAHRFVEVFDSLDECKEVIDFLMPYKKSCFSVNDESGKPDLWLKERAEEDERIKIHLPNGVDHINPQDMLNFLNDTCLDTLSLIGI